MGRVSLVTPDLPQGLTRLLISLVMGLLMSPWADACPRDCSCYSGPRGQTVSCRYQTLVDVPKDLPEDTAVLDMGHTSLTHLTADTFPSLPKLHELVLDWSQIESLDSNTFSSLPNLESLKLSNNKLKELRPEAFSGLTNLRHLHLDYNQIKRLPHGVFTELSLNELLLHSNKLEMLEDSAFEGTSIVNLNLDENNISNISIQLFNPLKNSLKQLNLSHNAQPLTMEEDVFSGFDFSDLRISYDGLKDSSFLKHVRAQSLDISGHHFSKLDFREWENLRTTQEFYLRNLSIRTLNDSILANLVSVTLLDVSENKLMSIDGDVFQSTPNLKVLILDHNLFMSLPENLGIHLSNLEVLKVSWNKLAVVRPDAFTGMTNLRKLDMENNLIQVLDQSMRSVFEELQVIMLGGNPLHCNCEMRWYRTWLEESRKDTGANDCHSPTRGYIYNIPVEDFVCRRPKVSFITQNMNANQGSDVYLTCRADGDPAPEVQWSSPFGETVSVTPPFNRTKYATTAIWLMKRIQARQGGWFTCTATNGIGITEDSMFIHVVTENGTAIDVDALTKPTTTTTPTTSTTTTTPTTTTPPTTTTVTATSATTTKEVTSSTAPSSTITVTSQTTAEVTSTQTREWMTPSSVKQKSITNSPGPGTKMPFRAWMIAVIIGCILGCVLIFTVIGVCVHKERKKKLIGKYDVNLESGVPMVVNNNHNTK